MDGYHRYSLLGFAERYGLTEHPFFEIAKYFGESDDYWIAGGAVRALLLDQPITTDVDFFFKSQEAYEAFVAKFSTDDNYKLATTEHHHTFKKEVAEGNWYKIQAIKIGYYATIEECLDSFDFTICQLGVRGGTLYVGEYTMWDLARKRLALHKLTYGAATVRRLLKYTKQGFTACSGCIASILKAVGENPSVINSEIQYVDQMTPADLRAICNSLNDERGTGGQSKLARMIGRSPRTIRRKLNGKSPITQADELAIRQALVLESREKACPERTYD